MPSLFTLAETKLMIQRYEWLGRYLFELLGGWVAQIDESDVKFRVGTHCYHYAWHAELWQNRLPEMSLLPQHNLGKAVEQVPQKLVGFADLLGSTNNTIEKLTGVYRVVLPRLISQLSHHLSGSSKVTDAPTIRILRLCLSDLIEDCREGESMLQILLGDDEAVDISSGYMAKLEKELVSSGGLMC